MNEKDLEEMTTAAARALGVAGSFRLVGDARMYVLDRAGAARWGEHLFDPLRNSEHSFLLAGVFELSVSFGTAYAIVRPYGVGGPVSTQMYARHPDRFAAARVAVARCVESLALLRGREAAALAVVPARGLDWA